MSTKRLYKTLEGSIKRGNYLKRNSNSKTGVTKQSKSAQNLRNRNPQQGKSFKSRATDTWTKFNDFMDKHFGDNTHRVNRSVTNQAQNVVERGLDKGKELAQDGTQYVKKTGLKVGKKTGLADNNQTVAPAQRSNNTNATSLVEKLEQANQFDPEGILDCIGSINGLKSEVEDLLSKQNPGKQTAVDLDTKLSQIQNLTNAIWNHGIHHNPKFADYVIESTDFMGNEGIFKEREFMKQVMPDFRKLQAKVKQHKAQGGKLPVEELETWRTIWVNLEIAFDAVLYSFADFFEVGHAKTDNRPKGPKEN